ncbi:TPA: hypothetical protein DCX16_04825 [bacterium]|nr:hypothetical protein [bacterium]
MNELSKIIKGLSDKTPFFGKGRRRNAVNALGKIGTKEVVPYLISTLYDSDDDVKREAYSSLCRLTDDSAIDTLCSLYLKDRDKKVWEIITAKGFVPSSHKEKIIFYIQTGQTAKCIPPSIDDIPILIEMLSSEEHQKYAIRILSSINDDGLKSKVFNTFFSKWSSVLETFLLNTGWTPISDEKKLIFYIFQGKYEDAIFIERRKKDTFALGYGFLGNDAKNRLINTIIDKQILHNFIFELLLCEKDMEIVKAVFGAIVEKPNFENIIVPFLKIKDDDFIINLINQLKISPTRLLWVGLEKGGFTLCMVANFLKQKGWKPEEPLLSEFMKYVYEIADCIVEINMKALLGEDMKYAINVLGKIKDEAPIDNLIALLKERDWRIRRLTSSSLVRIGTNKVLTSLISLFEEKDWGVRVIVAETLGRLGNKKIIEFLIKALSTEEWGYQEEASISLAKIGDPQSQNAFIKALRYNNQKIRKVTASALSVIGNHEAIEPLIRTLDDRDEGMRKIVSCAIARIIKRGAIFNLQDFAKRKSTLVKEGLIRSMGMVKDESSINFILHQALNEKDAKIRVVAVNALGKMEKPELAKMLIKILQDENQNVKKETAIALAKLGDERGYGILVDSIRGKNWRVQMDAIYTSHRYLSESKERIIRLLSDATKDQNPQTRAAAIIGLGVIRDERFIPTLLMAWSQEREPEIKKRIILSLVSIGGEKGIRAFTLGIADRNKDIRAVSAYGFGKIKTKDGFLKLLEKIDDENQLVRTNVFSSLRILIGEFGIELSERDLIILDKKLREMNLLEKKAPEATEAFLLKLQLGILKYKKKLKA